AQLLQGEPQPVSLLRGERLEVTAAFERLRMPFREHAMSEVDGRLGKLSEVFRCDVAAPAPRLDQAAEPGHERCALPLSQCKTPLAVGVRALFFGSLGQTAEAGDRGTASSDRRQGFRLEDVPVACGGEGLCEPSCFRTQCVELAR